MNLELGGVILTMADIRTNLTQQVIEEVRNYFKEKVFQAVIPRSVKLSEAPSFGKPAVIYDPHNRGSQAYVELGKEFLVRFGSDEDRQKISEKGAEAFTVKSVTPESNETKSEETKTVTSETTVETVTSDNGTEAEPQAASETSSTTPTNS